MNTAFLDGYLQKRAATKGSRAGKDFALNPAETAFATRNVLDSMANTSAVPWAAGGAVLGGVLGGGGSLALGDPAEPSMRRAAVLALVGAVLGGFGGKYLHKRYTEQLGQPV